MYNTTNLEGHIIYINELEVYTALGALQSTRFPSVKRVCKHFLIHSVGAQTYYGDKTQKKKKLKKNRFSFQYSRLRVSCFLQCSSSIPRIFLNFTFFFFSAGINVIGFTLKS